MPLVQTLPLVLALTLPRHAKAVATAFYTGKFNGTTYSGKYGDLGAAVAAILLDSEATSDVINLDPYYGRLREPLMKVMHVLRSMEFKTKDGSEMELKAVEGVWGQNAYASPTVFNFYLPDYQPDGRIIAANIVAPESQLLTPPFMFKFLNSMMGLVKWGLTMCLQPNNWQGIGTCSGKCTLHNGKPTGKCRDNHRRRHAFGNSNIDWPAAYTQNIKDTISGTLTWRPKLTGSDLNITQYFVSSEGTRMKVGTSPVSRRAWTDQFSFFAYNADTHPGTIRYYVSEAAGPRHRISTTSIQGAA